MRRAFSAPDDVLGGLPRALPWAAMSPGRWPGRRAPPIRMPQGSERKMWLMTRGTGREEFGFDWVRFEGVAAGSGHRDQPGWARVCWGREAGRKLGSFGKNRAAELLLDRETQTTRKAGEGGTWAGWAGWIESDSPGLA